MSMYDGPDADGLVKGAIVILIVYILVCMCM
jgi:hypothetical protein